ncbi:MAG: formimidoylglutamate deiminase [Gemmatimonadetes bacterium]|nr:formimidoylglutamate deiminase [Gemmatimonadota bacterium]MYD24686.1 formimidoylglutamate deiminase [Gemmatimonadota bacterium]MYI98225.1 formimidoylglutamate deiminase [Gemmatimonadota bacterium]
MNPGNDAPAIRFEAGRWIIPGLATAHSHAFQRALRGRTQRRTTRAGTFRGWRDEMYRLVQGIGPDDLYAISRFAYTELAMSGVTAVGEFHYVHHGPGGRPYEVRTELADAVVRAALDVGIRICLIRTAYLRAGYRQSAVPAQERFIDPSIDLVMQDLDDLRTRYADDPHVAVAVAAAVHSVRAVPIPGIRTLAAYADEHDIPFHMHVSEQRGELEECRAEHGTTPVALLSNEGVLSPRFVAVHATHLEDPEVSALGENHSFVCICRTTERDLGDGLPPTSGLLDAGARLCVGVDSHACENAFEEARAVELDERSRLERRHATAEGRDLLDAATRQGYAACGLEPQWQEDRVHLDGNDPSIAAIDLDCAPDAIFFGATPRAVESVVVAGRQIIAEGCHAQYDETLALYRKSLKKLQLI